MKRVLLLLLICATYLNAQSVPERVQKGMVLLSEGKIEEAERILEPVIRENPRHGAARFLLGQIAMERGEWNQAMEHLEIATSANPRRPDLVWQLYGKLHLLLHNHAAAERSFQQSLTHTSAFVPALIGHAQSALFLENSDAALRDLEAAAPKSDEATMLLAQTFIYLDRQEDAIHRLSSRRWDDESFASRAKILIDSIKNNRTGVVAFLSENLGVAEAYLAYGILELQKEDRASAATLFRIAFEIDDQNPVVYLFLKRYASDGEVAAPKIPQQTVTRSIAAAQAALAQQNADRAQAFAHEILVDRPMHMQARFIAIEAAEMKREYWDAFDQYSKIVRTIPGLVPVEARFAALAQKMELYDIAECLVRSAITAHSNDGYLHSVLASILESQEKLDEALAAAEKARELGFQNASLYVTLGNIYYRKMEIGKSIAALAKAVELDPRAAENIASFALTALTTDQYSALRNVLEKHVQAHPENVETLYSLAMMYANENQLERAKEYFARLEKLTPEKPEIYYNLALVYFRLGLQQQGEQAMARFEQLKEKERQEWLRRNGAHRIRIDASEALKAGNFVESIRLYTALSEDRLAQPDDWVALGNAYAAAGKAGEAFAAYEKALALAPYNREALAAAARSAHKDRAKLYSERLRLLETSCSN